MAVVDGQAGDRRRTLVTLWGVPLTMAANSWRFVPPKMIIGLLVAASGLPELSITDRLTWGVVYGLILILILLLHIAGHLASSRLVRPGMTELRITPLLIETRYDSDPDDLPGRIHVIRAIGGPLITTGLGVISGLIWLSAGHHLARFFAVASLALTFLVCLPLPGVDGEVIWREIRRGIRRRVAANG